MNYNPEFLRNVWLELTPHRLIGMPAVLLAIFFLTYLITGNGFAESARMVALTSYFILTLLWGTRMAGEALLNEIQDLTWDQQRMSSISPWSMAWGKLFGSTIFPWYGAIICLLIYALTALQLNQSDVIKYVVFLLAIAVLAQAVALLSSVQTIKIYHRSASSVFMLLGIIAALPLVSWAFKAETGFLSWYGRQFRVLDFLLLSVCCFAAWSLVGIYRKMREELQFRNTPVYWFAFCVFVAIYLAGILQMPLPDDELVTVRLFTAYTVFIVLAYVMVMLEDKNPLMIRRILVARQQRNWRGVFENTPCWFVTLLSVYALGLVLMFYAYPDFALAGRYFSFKSYLAAMALFLTRDVLIFIFFNMSANRRRADVTAIFYLLLLYWLLPAILGGMNLPMVKAALLPFGTPDDAISIVSGLSQCVILGVLVLQRWRKLYQKSSAISQIPRS
ncbi:MAG: hypothetical protein L0Z73_15140 [Gammaproteobacteria bacterium]|nr:hypothetical protein [Gammaproteobacteria bacterium]